MFQKGSAASLRPLQGDTFLRLLLYALLILLLAACVVYIGTSIMPVGDLPFQIEDNVSDSLEMAAHYDHLVSDTDLSTRPVAIEELPESYPSAPVRESRRMAQADKQKALLFLVITLMAQQREAQ
jgi:hypothetical protein